MSTSLDPWLRITPGMADALEKEFHHYVEQMVMRLRTRAALHAPPVVSFTVYGKPQPAGSKRAVYKKGMNYARVIDDNPKAPTWKNAVAQVAGEKMAGLNLLDGPLAMSLVFYRQRPKGHYLAGGGLNATGRRNPYPTVIPDVSKLTRGVEDALKGVAYRDDSRLIFTPLLKLYGEPEGARVTIYEL